MGVGVCVRARASPHMAVYSPRGHGLSMGVRWN